VHWSSSNYNAYKKTCSILNLPSDDSVAAAAAAGEAAGAVASAVIHNVIVRGSGGKILDGWMDDCRDIHGVNNGCGWMDDCRNIHGVRYGIGWMVVWITM
jgi:hypothetical protein